MLHRVPRLFWLVTQTRVTRKKKRSRNCHRRVDFTEVQQTRAYLPGIVIYISPLNPRRECTNVQDTFRRRIVIYLLCLLRAFSRKQRERTAELRISQLTGGRKRGTRHPPDGGFAVTLKIQSENSVTCETAARANASKD